jgi:tetratricopeptide (TPR) repeat protein
MKRLSVLLMTLGPVAMVVAVVTLGACAGTQPEETAAPAAPGAAPVGPSKKSMSGDVSFELPPTELKGVIYEPEALGRPGMPLIDAKRPTTIEKQRALVQTTKDPIQKQAQAAVLATMLYRESKTDKNKEKADLTEARKALHDVVDAVGEKGVDEITLRLLGSYELLFDDYAPAEKAWRDLIEKDPKAKDVPESRAWLAYAQLKQFKNADALATVGNDKPDDKQPELAYVTAWAKLRGGDGAAAWQAIVAASRGWGQNANREELDHEVLWFAGRAGVSLDHAASVITGVLGKTKPQQFELLARLGLASYAGVGRWADAIAALDKAVELAGDTVPPNDRPVIRYSQADFAVRIDAPDAAAKFARQAVEALDACRDKCAAKDRTDMIQGVYLMGRLFHILYATSNDKHYYEPAHQLYELTIPKLDPTNQAQAQQDLKKLETTLKNMKVGTGTHDKGALGALLPRHGLEIQACYEAALQNNRKLAGTIAVNLESDATGAIKGVSTEPRPGAADLGAVAACVLPRARQWKLPTRGMAGTTRIKISFALSVKS